MTALAPPRPLRFASPRQTRIESDWPLEEPGLDDGPVSGGEGEFDSELESPLDDCLLPDDDYEAFPEPGDFWLDDFDDRDDEPW